MGDESECDIDESIVFYFVRTVRPHSQERTGTRSHSLGPHMYHRSRMDQKHIRRYLQSNNNTELCHR